MDKFSKETRSKIMSAIRSTHTSPELKLGKALSAKHYKFRLQYGKEKIDIAFPRKKVAIFVDGCFWHMCPKHGHLPKSKKTYWHPKLKKNVQRAKEKNKRLRLQGWKTIHIWEHELSQIGKVVRKIGRVCAISK